MGQKTKTHAHGLGQKSQYSKCLHNSLASTTGGFRFIVVEFPQSPSASSFLGIRNLNQMGMIVKRETAAATTKGDWGLIFSHINVPRYGAGRESNPMLP